MIDLHNHLLSGLDDGPKTFSESKIILEKSSKQGINRILATPHRKDVLENQASQSLIDQVELLNQYSIQSELNIEVYVGMENHLDTTLCELAMKGIAFTINYGSYIFLSDPLLKCSLTDGNPSFQYPNTCLYKPNNKSLAATY